MKKTGFVIALIFILGGCETTFDPPVIVEMRRVTGIENSDQAIVINSDMKFEDGRPVGRILRLPKGIYTLEAQDEAYYFYRSENGIEISHLKKSEGKFEANQHPGGLMIHKQIFFRIKGDFYYTRPAVIYLKGKTEDSRFAIRDLNKDFLRQRGFIWDKTKITPDQLKVASR